MISPAPPNCSRPHDAARLCIVRAACSSSSNNGQREEQCRHGRVHNNDDNHSGIGLATDGETDGWTQTDGGDDEQRR